MGRVWTPREVRELITKYPIEGASALARKLHRSADSVSSKAAKYKIKSPSRRQRQARTRATQTQSVNARFFNDLTPTVAHVLGFIWGCGGIKSRHRLALRLACDEFRGRELQQVLHMLQSQHQIQQHGWKLVVEICNSHLVKELTGKYGTPPGRTNPNPPLPVIPEQLLHHFAQGHLDAAGQHTETIIRWTGTPQQIRELKDRIQEITSVGEPKQTPNGKRNNIFWRESADLQRLENWFNQSKLSTL